MLNTPRSRFWCEMQELRPARTRSIFQIVLWCLAGVLLIQNLLLLRQNGKLRRLANRQPVLGDTLRDLAGVQTDGTLHKIPMPTGGSERLLIITFSANCPTCLRNEPGWRKVIKELEGRPAWKVVWVSRDTIDVTRRHFDSSSGWQLTVFCDPPYRTWFQLELQTLPNTIVVGPGG